jgi:hypothetical protein
MVFKFNFFRGLVGPRKIILRHRLSRTPIAHIPVPSFTATVSEYRRAFINGWRACEFGREIYECPDLEMVELKREWEYGYTECYNTRREELVNIDITTELTDEQCYLQGWSSSRLGFPLNHNPHQYGSHQYNMWNCGWNDFVDNH